MDFDICFLAMYSSRKGTKAAQLRDDVSRKEKKVRWHQLQDLMEKMVYRKNQAYIDKIVSVLIDRVEPSFCEGNSLEMKRVRITGSKAKLGDIIEVKVARAREWMLFGT